MADEITITDANNETVGIVQSNSFMQVISTLQETNGYLERIDDSFSYVIDMLEANRLYDLENQREKNDSSKRIGTPTGKIKEEDDGIGLGAKLFKQLLGLGAVLLVAGIAASLLEIETGLKKLDEALAKPRKILENLQLATTDAIEAIVNFWESSIVENFQALALKPFSTRIRAGLMSIGASMQKFGDDILATGSKFFEGIGKKFSNLGKFTKVLGVIFRPIVILFEGISRAFEEFGKLGEDATIGDYIQAAGKVVIKTFLSFWTGLGDLAKSFSSWIIEKIAGDDNPVSKFLDSFSFTELMEKIVDLVFEGWNMLLNADWGQMFDDGIKIMQDGIKNLWQKTKDLFSSIGEVLKESIKTFVSAILPEKDAFKFTVDEISVFGKKILSRTEIDFNPIPSELYEWAGEGSKKKISATASGTSTAMTSAAAERRIVLERDSMQGLGAGAITPSINVFNNQKVNNSSTNVQQASNNGAWMLQPASSNTRANPVGWNSIL